MRRRGPTTYRSHRSKNPKYVNDILMGEGHIFHILTEAKERGNVEHPAEH